MSFVELVFKVDGRSFPLPLSKWVGRRNRAPYPTAALSSYSKRPWTQVSCAPNARLKHDLCKGQADRSMLRAFLIKFTKGLVLGARRFDTAYIFGWFCSPQHHLLPRPQRRLLAHREPAEMGRSRPLRLPPAPEDRRQGHIPGASLQFPGASRQLEMLRLSHRRVSVFLALFPAPPRIHRVVKSTIDDRMNSRNCVKSPDRCFRK